MKQKLINPYKIRTKTPIKGIGKVRNFIWAGDDYPAKYVGTIKEDIRGNWDDHWDSMAGEHVIHAGNYHHIYIARAPKKRKQR